MTTEMQTRAVAASGSLNVEARTIDVVFASEAPVRRHSWEEGRYDEILLCGRENVDLSRADNMSLLDTHGSYRLDDRLGSVVPGSIRFEREKVIATVKLSLKPKAEEILQDLQAGQSFPISVGYRITQEERTEAPAGGIAVVRALKWQPMEISIVPTPADPNAKTRSQKEIKMDPETIDDTQQQRQQYQRPANLIAERKRVKDIRDLGRSANMGDEADAAIDDGMPVEAFRAQVFDKMVERQSQTPTFPIAETRGTGQERNGEMDARVNALVARITGKAPEDEARQFMSSSLLDHARGLLEAGGVNTRNMSREQILSARSRSYGMHTTSDFPLLLQGVGDRVLQEAYQEAQSPLKRFLSRQTTATDFRAKSKLKVSDGGLLEKVNEHGEIKATTRSEAAESYRIETYGRIFALTFQAIVNDDLDAFGDWSRWAGQMAAMTENNVLLNLLTKDAGAGPVMTEDNKTLFHADHGNLASIGTALDEENLGAAILAFRQQKAMGGHRIAVAPKYLLVGPELELKAQKLVASISATTTNDAVPEAIKNLIPLVEPNLDGKAWYLFASSASAPVFEHAYLAGHEGVQLNTEEGFEVLGARFRAVLHFGAGSVDFRGAYRNPGL
jgi:phage head maturation protease